jgi:osmotically-inducible protein OsmY
MTDLEVKNNVESELSWEPGIDAAEIGVAVKDGIVTLTGRVLSYWEKVEAEQPAARVLGVKAIVTIWRKKLCSLLTTLLVQKCNLCLRYDL